MPALGPILDEVWAMLARGLTDRSAASRLPTLVTVGANGEPSARTIVLRDCRREDRRLVFFADARSEKIREIEARPTVALHLHEPASSTQLRLSGVARVHRASAGDPIALAAWEGTPEGARSVYRTVQPPTTAVDDHGDIALDPTMGARHFAVLALEIIRIEYLRLTDEPHQRARFEWDGAGWVGTWLVP